jgi:hypothetical protein
VATAVGNKARRNLPACLVTRMTAPLLLPRVIDHSELGQVEFEGWLAGVRGFDPRCLYRDWSSKTKLAPRMKAEEQNREPDSFEERCGSGKESM